MPTTVTHKGWEAKLDPLAEREALYLISRAQGNRQNQTEWHRVVLFGTLAANALQYLGKGSQVYIEGRLRTRKWQDQQGFDRYSTEVVGHDMQFIGSKPSSAPPAATQPTNPPSPSANQGDDFDDDIPF